MSEQTTAVSTRVGTDIMFGAGGQLQFNNYAAVLDFTAQLVAANMAPKGKTKEQCAISIVFGMQIGLPVLASIQNIAVINGMPSVWGDAADGLVKASGQEEWSRCEEIGTGKDFCVRYSTKRKGAKEAVTRTFGYQDAITAHLWGKEGPWSNYPKRMMFNRARAWAIRDAYPDILKGIKIAEEVIDVEAVSVSPIAEPQRPVSAAQLIEAAPKPSATIDENTPKMREAHELPPIQPTEQPAEPDTPTTGKSAENGKEPF